MGFTRIGYLCRHVFSVFRYNKIDHIPQQYLPRRWKRDALPNDVYSLENRYCVDNSDNSILRNEIMEIVCSCADRLRCDTERLSAFVEQLRKIKNDIFVDVPSNPDYNSTSAVIGMFVFTIFC